ncbi:MAG: hypothetical protein LBD86_06775 [Spirochaetaceae bacterium]|nr:hypothetical protein [Spirochaetaceae bacterium]
MTFLIVLGVSCKSAPKNVEQIEPEPVQAEKTDAEPEPEHKEEAALAVEEAEEVPEVVENEDGELLARKQAMYRELGETLTEARAKRQEIMKAELNNQYKDRFDPSDAALVRASNSYEAGLDAVDEDSLSAAHYALDGFTSIIEDVLLTKAESLHDTSDGMRQQALKLKADVAVKQGYDFAAGLYNKGNAAMSGKDYAAAADFYQESIPAFIEAINIATEKKVKAERALKDAEEKIVQSEKIVEEAEKQLETGENGEML